MWNKLHFLLSAPGVASITQLKAIDAACWVPQCGGGWVFKGDPPRGPGCTFQKQDSTTPQAVAILSNHTGLKGGFYVCF